MGCKDIGIRKFEFVTKTQFLWETNFCFCWPISGSGSVAEPGSGSGLKPSSWGMWCDEMCFSLYT